ncbi:helix-turn-helix domain-containing protein [uncultured Roseovarius sp.]|uniref:helix-turn-helix domain-containing protein n=1 Tax=Roseovarius sp. TaxID=1486281 RepID=UPI001DD399DC|nr:XRE family transcriptional regulator [uncultured Roseovarius sp.]TNE37577.1 MAG: cupin domain-containing protein [Sphingomonadales bacterium]
MVNNLPKVLRPSNKDGLAEGDRDKVNLKDVTDLDPRVGKEIRGLRKARDATIADLSKATGLSKGYLSQIERGISSPSIKALHSISRALGVTISWFFPPQTDEDEALRDTVVRADGRRSLTFKNGITDELLSPNLDGEIELLRCIFPPGSTSGAEAYTHRGEEAGFVIEGRLDLWLDGRHIQLNAGDSFAFRSDRPHRYANVTDETTIVIWSISPPTY